MLLYFSLTLFASATLLFLVQPMIGKMILPQLGGTPAVWNTCMVFFQGVLLVGYGYTHVLTTTQPTRRQVLIQGIMLFFPFLVLPFSLGNWEPPTETNPIFSLVAKLTVLVGLPFFAVSTTAPLLQKWFVHTGHPAASDPYFLYGASNLGSMLGLALYPTFIEPWLPVTAVIGRNAILAQVNVWTIGFAIFVGLVIGCAVVVWRSMGKSPDIITAPSEASPPAAPLPESATAISAKPRRGVHLDSAASITAPVHVDFITPWRRLRWIGLAAAPSSLMLGVTTYMTTDIAAVAFFWILPLALYLFTFILVFARWPVVWTGLPHTLVMLVQPCLMLFLVLKMIAHLSPPTWAEFSLHLAAFFSTTLMCHGELAKDRPSTKHLTEFYFWMSLGGVLGGLFNALLAPIAFQHGIWEYPMAMAFACLMRSNLVEDIKTLIPGDSTPDRPTVTGHVLDWSMPVAVALLAYFFSYAGANYYHIAIVLNALVGLGIIFVVAVGWIAVDYYAYADHTNTVDWDYLRGAVTDRGRAIVIGLLLLLDGGFFLSEKAFAFNLLRTSYLLAALVVVVLALSLRPVRFGLSVAALFIGTTIYDRVHDDLVYEGRGFFGLLRVRENEPMRIPLPVVNQKDPEHFETKVYRTLIHGGINHGRQIVSFKAEIRDQHGDFVEWAPEDGLTSEQRMLLKRREPITYFHESNGVAEIYRKFTWPAEEVPGKEKALPAHLQSHFQRADTRLPVSMVGMMCGSFGALSMLVNTQSEPPYAVVGLGTGILAAYAKPYQAVHFYEIDPLVKRLSIVDGYRPPWDEQRSSMPANLPEPVFYYLHDAQERWSNIDVILGDGRLKIKNAPEKYYHIISLDAFSSDAIPVHLLTEEAVKIYLSKLAEGGVLIFNTTNKFVRIEGVLAAIAKKLDCDCLACADWAKETDHPDRFSADWVVLQPRIDKDTYRNGGPPIEVRLEVQPRKRLSWNGHPVLNAEGLQVTEKRWEPVEPLAGPVWTDGYSNLLKIMEWR